ncbi:MAG: hypothetical protein V3R88_11370, partial [Alphaproteobacteria bacterium]
ILYAVAVRYCYRQQMILLECPSQTSKALEGALKSAFWVRIAIVVLVHAAGFGLVVSLQCD